MQTSEAQNTVVKTHRSGMQVTLASIGDWADAITDHLDEGGEVVVTMTGEPLFLIKPAQELIDPPDAGWFALSALYPRKASVVQALNEQPGFAWVYRFAKTVGYVTLVGS